MDLIQDPHRLVEAHSRIDQDVSETFFRVEKSSNLSEVTFHRTVDRSIVSFEDLVVETIRSSTVAIDDPRKSLTESLVMKNFME